MKVKVNSKKAILKAFSGWLPLILFSVFFYGVVIFIPIVLFLEQIIGLENELATQLSYLTSGLLILIGGYFYLNSLTNSLSSYNLSIENDNLIIEGRSGWKSISTKVSLSNIEKIYLGKSSHNFERLAFGAGSRQVKDQVASRLTFFPINQKPIKLDFATKAFDGESLYDFLVFLKSNGIETNVGV
ncbi:hypothetical protein [Methylophaga sp.]|uniref:hypothetical protein n=1 Tax=Methylophaga sp. TaxID=2024840 RepID=UPI002726D872|nr:hypothetical protein [Methylophaga sp.]MDO8826198.1 hypothetical protein [Methylophaga sp.]